MKSLDNCLVVSRFFYDNVKFVAKMCPRCYKESEEVQIIGINLQFIKQTDSNLYDYLMEEDVMDYKSELNYRQKNNLLINRVSYKNYRKKYSQLLRLRDKKTKYKWRICCKKMRTKNNYFNKEEKYSLTEDASKNLFNLEKHEKNVSQQQILPNFITDYELQYFEQRQLATKSNLDTFTPPKSPHNLIEESLYDDPWALLVATIFLNRTSCSTARPYIFWFLLENPDPLTVLDKFPGDLQKYFVKLGLVKTRAVQVYRMSHDFLFKKWKSVRQLYGIGDYGECAYRMFCLGDFSVEPKDRFLKIYKAWHQKVYSSENNCYF